MATLPEALTPIAWLEGSWRCEKSTGTFPTIKDFEYGEDLTFNCVGQPMFMYKSLSWHAEKRSPMHSESGYLRIKPGTNELSFLVAHNFGVTSIEEGVVEGQEIKLSSTNIGRMKFAKDPAVTKLVRTFAMEGDVLIQTLFMETSNTPLTKHLCARYKKL